MEKPTSIQDFPQSINLTPRTLLITNVTPGIQFDRSTNFYDDLKMLIGYQKRHTTTKVDYVQRDLCEFKTYGNYLSYLDKIEQRNSVVVYWMPGCRMPFRITTRLPYQ